MNIIIFPSQKFPTASLKFFNKKRKYFYLQNIRNVKNKIEGAFTVTRKNNII